MKFGHDVCLIGFSFEGDERREIWCSWVKGSVFLRLVADADMTYE